MLQLDPSPEIIQEFIMNDDFKYLRALGAFYIRLTAKAEQVYTLLEPLYVDYLKLALRSLSGWDTCYMDTFIDSLLNDEVVCDIALPFLQPRDKLENIGLLKPRISSLDHILQEEQEQKEAEVPNITIDNNEISLRYSSSQDKKKELV